MKKIQELKVILKDKAEAIRKYRIELKAKQRVGDVSCGMIQSGLHGMGWEYRHYHIAYCELRGKTRDHIEMPKVNNKADETFIYSLKIQFAWEVPEMDKAAGAE